LIHHTNGRLGGMVLPELNDFVGHSILLSTSGDTVASTYLFSHTCLICALHRGCMDRVECVVDTPIVASPDLLNEIRQLQNKLKVQLPHQL